jgi:hypothetical protein
MGWKSPIKVPPVNAITHSGDTGYIGILPAKPIGYNVL